MALSDKIVLEVAMNPQDLVVQLTRENDGHNFIVRRGPVGARKLLFISEKGVKTREQALIDVLKVLREIHAIALKKTGECLLYVIHIDEIEKALKENNIVRTVDVLAKFYDQSVHATA